MIPLGNRWIVTADAFAECILEATLIENDRIDSSPVTNVQSNVALVYWLETSSSLTSTTSVTTRAKVVRDVDQWSNRLDFTPANRTWAAFSSTATTTTVASGAEGGISGGNPNLLPLWVEPTASWQHDS